MDNKYLTSHSYANPLHGKGGRAPTVGELKSLISASYQGNQKIQIWPHSIVCVSLGCGMRYTLVSCLPPYERHRIDRNRCLSCCSESVCWVAKLTASRSWTKAKTHVEIETVRQRQQWANVDRVETQFPWVPQLGDGISACALYCTLDIDSSRCEQVGPLFASLVTCTESYPKPI